MRTVLFNDGWKFKLMPVDSGYEKACDETYDDVEIPHDWLIYDTKELYKSGEGWYKKTFDIENKGSSIYTIEFDGVYMDSSVYVNGKEVGRWHYGYSAFNYDITDYLNNGENVIMVQVRHISPNSRWYSGAGIFRNVHLTKTNPIHFTVNGVYISADGNDGTVKVSTEIVGNYDYIRYIVYDMDGKEAAVSDKDNFKVDKYIKWGIESPYLYTLKSEIIKEGSVTDTYECHFGFRTIKFDPDNGFFLNGEYMKLKGVCLHHDLGALGSAVNYRATERQVMIMKEMGVNAIRTSHNMPSRELIDICDKVGMLVDSESFDMWELHKTEHDYATYFKESAHDDVISWVKNDRNHPCVIMWSIGNEIYDTHVSDHGIEIAKMLADFVREADPEENAVLTIASNYIEGEYAQQIGKMLVHSGYNYTEKCYDDHHKRYPDTVIYGSETASAVRSRGIYHFPADLPLLSHDDNQCSSLENSYASWGRLAEDAWIQDRNRKFCAGQFVWTGIDYIGEPTPYKTKNSYFGIVDTAGLPKDVYFFYQSVWTDVKNNSMIHLLPYWDFNEGQIIDVIAYTNAPQAELFLNGKSLGIQKIDHINGTVLHAVWKVKYTKGTLTVNAMDESGTIIASETQKSFGDPASIKLCSDRTEIKADGYDLFFVEISTSDIEGTLVANARNRIKVQVNGSGRLLGLDNGDSTDYEQYKSDNRKLFSGKLVAIIGSDCTAGEINVKVTSEGLESAELNIKATECNENVNNNKLIDQILYTEYKKDIPIRKIEAYTDGCCKLDENHKSLEVNYKLLPENATYNDISCKIVKINSVETNIAQAEYVDGVIKVTAKGDGECILRIYAYNGSDYPQVISDVPLEITGLGEAVCNPYRMVSASAYSSSSIPVSIIENGALGGFTEPCWICYNTVDFGKVGTESFKIYMGNCCGRDIPVEIWDGTPDNGTLIMTAMFPHNNGWGSFEPYDFKLPERIKGLHNISFKVFDKCIFGGFEFVAEDKAYAKLSAVDNNSLYGDEFTVKADCVEGIGNNVVIEFNDMDFGAGATKIQICGRTVNDVNTIQLRYDENGESKKQLLEFKHAGEFAVQEFELNKITGKTNICFVFMPGSKFDFRYFRFIK